jgi:argininosuccinate lyase
MKLWQKEYDLNKKIEKFSVGNDYLLDKRLVKYDCLGSIAHAKTLNKIDLLTNEELKQLIENLNQIITLNSKGNFQIEIEDEDCHTAIEKHLTKNLGNIGKKIHTCRSRNDQVLTAMRLYEKEEIVNINNLINNFIAVIDNIIKKHGNIPIPGYTHMQKAMPTTISMWLGQFSDSAKDNLLLLNTVNKLIDQSPLGSAAGFGVPVFDLDKKLTAKNLGFAKIMDNAMYCQLSRGKFEAQIINVLTCILYDLNKLATDLILFSMKEFNYITLNEEICTGSSIMPQKKNPDVLELLRAKYHIVLGEEIKLKGLIGNLMSGYNRDLQLTKEPLFNSIDTTKDCLKIICIVLNNISINEDKCNNAMTPELFATEEAYKLVKNGMPFRDAYKIVSKKFS